MDNKFGSFWNNLTAPPSTDPGEDGFAKFSQSFREHFWKTMARKFCRKTDLVEAINLVQKSSKSELSSRFFGRSKFLAIAVFKCIRTYSNVFRSSSKPIYMRRTWRLLTFGSNVANCCETFAIFSQLFASFSQFFDLQNFAKTHFKRFRLEKQIDNFFSILFLQFVFRFIDWKIRIRP